MAAAIRKPLRLYDCPWCKERKIASEMRHPGCAKGKVLSTCMACRQANPDQSWCDFHQQPHPSQNFRRQRDGRPGYRNVCREAINIKLSEARERPPQTCLVCGTEQQSWSFRGGRMKSPVCRSCADAHAGLRWCLDCEAWLAESAFNRTGKDGRFWTVRCKPCRAAHSHGTTVAEILRLQGSVIPECAACGSTADLKVDHDHDCCPAGQSAGCCVRGYLCHECNTAEGLLRTPERALALARYMLRLDKGGAIRPPAGLQSNQDAPDSSTVAMR